MRLTAVHERVLIVLVALHSFMVGSMLLLAPQWALRFGGWNGIDPDFFGRQAGVFHFALATAYLLEYFRYRGVSVLLTAKSIAVVFLLGSWLAIPLPWAVLVSGSATASWRWWWCWSTVESRPPIQGPGLRRGSRRPAPRRSPSPDRTRTPPSW